MDIYRVKKIEILKTSLPSKLFKNNLFLLSFKILIETGMWASMNQHRCEYLIALEQQASRIRSKLKPGCTTNSVNSYNKLTVQNKRN